MEQTRLAEDGEMPRFLSRLNAFNEEQDVNSSTRHVHRSSPVPGQPWHLPPQPGSGPELTRGSRSISKSKKTPGVLDVAIVGLAYCSQGRILAC